MRCACFLFFEKEIFLRVREREKNTVACTLAVKLYNVSVEHNYSDKLCSTLTKTTTPNRVVVFGYLVDEQDNRKGVKGGTASLVGVSRATPLTGVQGERLPRYQ